MNSKFIEKIFIKIFGVVFNGDNSIFDRYQWLKANLISLKKNSNLLDVGCGNGWATFLATQKGYKSTGLTWSEEEAKKLKRRSELLNLPVESVVHDARQLDKFKVEKKFDVIINSENIEHIIDDNKLINDISNLLNRNGLLYLTTTNLFFAPLLFIKEDPIKKLKVEDGSHVVRGYTFKKLEKMLEKNGLFAIHKSYIGGPFSRFLLSISTIFSHKIFKIFYIPLSIVFQKIDHVFFKNNVKNLCVAIIAEKKI